VPGNIGAVRPIVVSDFDGTLTAHDLGTKVLERFGSAGWKRFDELFERGQISLSECLREQTALINAPSKDEILRYLFPFSEFRPGMETLLAACGRGNLVVASAGIDFCIRRVFRKAGLSLPHLCCPATESTPRGFRIVMPRTVSLGGSASIRLSPGENFKQVLVAGYRNQGRTVVYLGDGVADIAPASIADKVFAIDGSPLATACPKDGIACTTIRTLDPVARYLRSQTSRWEQVAHPQSPLLTGTRIGVRFAQNPARPWVPGLRVHAVSESQS
jgi:2-hydroxy-3-keto-5-methylthiopentenyl-1-phosphate phosphatase